MVEDRVFSRGTRSRGFGETFPLRDIRVMVLILAYTLGAAVDIWLTYIYVKELGLYMEANPFIALYWLDKPLWMWLMRDLIGLLIALFVSISYWRFMAFLTSISHPNSILNYMKKAWMWPLYLAAVLRCLPAIHNVLLIFFHIETPLPEIIHKLLIF